MNPFFSDKQLKFIYLLAMYAAAQVVIAFIFYLELPQVFFDTSVKLRPREMPMLGLVCAIVATILWITHRILPEKRILRYLYMGLIVPVVGAFLLTITVANRQSLLSNLMMLLYYEKPVFWLLTFPFILGLILAAILEYNYSQGKKSYSDDSILDN